MIKSSPYNVETNPPTLSTRCEIHLSLLRTPGYALQNFCTLFEIIGYLGYPQQLRGRLIVAFNFDFVLWNTKTRGFDHIMISMRP